jgi:hypothetical protein
LAVAVVPPSRVRSESPRTPPLLRRCRPPLPGLPPTWAAGAPRAPPKTPVELRCHLGRQATVKSNWWRRKSTSAPPLDFPTSSSIPRPPARFPRPELYSPALYLDSVAAPRCCRSSASPESCGSSPCSTAPPRPHPRRRPALVAPRRTLDEAPAPSCRAPSRARPPSRHRPPHLARRSPSAPPPEAPPPDLRC